MRIKIHNRLLFSLFFLLGTPNLRAQPELFGPEVEIEDSAIIHYQRSLVRLIYRDKAMARNYIDSMQRIWPKKYNWPLTLKDKYLVETYLERPDSAIVWFGKPEYFSRSALSFMSDSGKLADSTYTRLVDEALRKSSFKSFIRERREDFLFTEFMRKLVYYKTPGRISNTRGFGAYQIINAQIFLEQNGETRYKPFVEELAKQSFLPSKFRYGFGITVRPFTQFIGAEFWLGVERWTFSLGPQLGAVYVKALYGKESHVSLTTVDWHRLLMAQVQAQYTLPIRFPFTQAINMSAGFGYARFNLANEQNGKQLISKPSDGNILNVSFGYRIGFSRGWTFSNEVNNKRNFASWSEFYLMPQVGYQKVSDALDAGYVEITFGLSFGFTKPTNKASTVARKWYRWKDLVVPQKGNTFPVRQIRSVY